MSMNAELGVPLVPFVAAPEKVDNTHESGQGCPRSLSTAFERIKKVWKRFGPFSQDCVTQITYIVPQFIAYWKLEELAKSESCNSEATELFEGAWPFTYVSAAGTSNVAFDFNQLHSECGVRYQSIDIPMNLLLAVMILQHFVFAVINILKVSRRVKYSFMFVDSIMSPLQGVGRLTHFLEFESWCSLLQLFFPHSSVEEECRERGLCRFVYFCLGFMLGNNLWCGVRVRGPPSISKIYMPLSRKRILPH
jgi:hypothetical protein